MCNPLAKLLQEIIASQKNQHNASRHMSRIASDHMLRFVNRLILFVQRRAASDHTHRIASHHGLRFVNRLILFVQRRTASPHRTIRTASHWPYPIKLAISYKPESHRIVIRCTASHLPYASVCNPTDLSLYKQERHRSPNAASCPHDLTKEFATASTQIQAKFT